MGHWKYEIVHDYDASKLVQEFRKENLKLKYSKGTDDEELDFIMYAEKDDHTISLGRVLLVKMSDAMIKRYYEYKNPNFLPEFWAKHIYEEHKNVKTFQFKEEEISDAFIDSIKLQTEILNMPAVDLQNYIKKIAENVSNNFRNDERFSREEWDPTLKSDKYLFAEPEKAVDNFIGKLNSLIKILSGFRKQLEIFKFFKILGKKIKAPLIDDIIRAIDDITKGIQNFKNWLIESKEDIKIKIPYICGIYT